MARNNIEGSGFQVVSERCNHSLHHGVGPELHTAVGKGSRAADAFSSVLGTVGETDRIQHHIAANHISHLRPLSLLPPAAA